MADQAASPTTQKNNLLTKGMVKDLSDVFLGEGVWTHARNALNTTHRGDGGVLSNEPSNELLASAPFDVIGLVHQADTTWVVFSTNDTTGEIGLFNERLQTYSPVIRSDELHFSTSHLIGGACKLEYDTTYSVYWQDNLNPDRCLNLSAIPYKTTGRNLSPDPSCFVPEYTTELDTRQILLHPYLATPSLELTRNPGGGQLPAGSYQVSVAYSVKGIRVTNYFTPSNVVAMWSHGGGGGALKVKLTNLDDKFEEFELVLVSVLNGQTVARKVGTYSTRQQDIVLDQVSQAQPVVELKLLSLSQPIYHKSEGMHELNGYLIRSGVSTCPDFNYQPQANKIQVNWVSVSYPAEYYFNSGTSVGYLRDEVYCFFIQWIYNTGLKSASYHIPGRAPQPSELLLASGQNVLPGETRVWQTEDTSTSRLATGTTPDGGVVTARGTMQYWESTERYPDRSPLIWGDLCGKPVRHHKFPSNEASSHYAPGGQAISVLGVEFTGISLPLDEFGHPIEDIVGYQILRGSREGNKSIVAKGLLNNLVEYTIPGNSQVKGLYQNYPYNDLRPDKFLLNRDKPLPGSGDVDDERDPVTGFQSNKFSFHSPDTTFYKPFLSGVYLQQYLEVSGTVNGGFSYAYEHPREKLITNYAFAIASVVGLGIAVLGAIGSGNMKTDIEAGGSIIIASGSITSGWAREGGTATAIPDAIANAIFSPATTLSGVAFMIVAGSYYAGMGIDEALRIIYNMSASRQYVLQYDSHGFYSQFNPVAANERRRAIGNGQVRYVGSYVQDFSATHRLNNWGRQPLVALETTQSLSAPSVRDNTRQRVQDRGSWLNPIQDFTTTTSSRYVALKVPTLAQYGQLDSVIQIPVHSGTRSLGGERGQSGILFGGDTYITRYTEKNPYHYFNKWLGPTQPDNFEYNYLQGLNGPPPRYWANFEHFDVGNMNLGIEFPFSDDSDTIQDGDTINLGLAKIRYNKPSSLHALDHDGPESNSGFTIKDGFMYLFNNGVRDFFVESELNLAFRDHGEQPGERFFNPYDHYADLPTLFRSDLILTPEPLRYDLSLSVGKLYYNYVSWASLVGRDFDPLTQASRFTYFPDRAIYSLQHQAGLRRDNWKSFLANNYRDFNGKRITQIKALNATGALILFENGEPVQFVGVDQLKTDGGVKITIGDGGLFQQGLQSVVNADDSLEHGSCQSKRASINTPQGLFWVSQKTGKVLWYPGGGQATDITSAGMSRWFAQYLPCFLQQQFPTYPLLDNPVAGVGCSVVYDPNYELLFFSKRDFQLREEFLDTISYNPASQQFVGVDKQPVLLTDARYFEDCSWTLSYDPKSKAWVSFHDWVPALAIPSYQHFLTVQKGSFYRHNVSTTSYNVYYGVNYPFEIEVPVTSMPQVTLVRSVEYELECYRYTGQGRNAFHLLEENFDQAMLYNTEQHSGLLELVAGTTKNPVQNLQYPKLVGTTRQVLCTKVEQKYRFNQFWDNTRDRVSGTFVPMYLHENNGYKRTLNPAYFNYTLPATQHKRFRHYGNRLLLRRLVAGATHLILRLTTTKLSASAR